MGAADGDRRVHALPQRAEMRKRSLRVTKAAQGDEARQEFEIGEMLTARRVMAGRDAIGRLRLAFAQQRASQIGAAVGPCVGIAKAARIAAALQAADAGAGVGAGVGAEAGAAATKPPPAMRAADADAAKARRSERESMIGPFVRARCRALNGDRVVGELRTTRSTPAVPFSRAGVQEPSGIRHRQS